MLDSLLLLIAFTYEMNRLGQTRVSRQIYQEPSSGFARRCAEKLRFSDRVLKIISCGYAAVEAREEDPQRRHSRHNLRSTNRKSGAFPHIKWQSPWSYPQLGISGAAQI
jgi:hypothetical protein